MSDSIAQALISTKNAQAAHKTAAKVVYSKTNYELLKILAQHGFVKGVERAGKKEKKYLEVALQYDERQSGAIHAVKRVSKPGRRVYIGYRELRWPKGSLLIVSTPQGLMPAYEAKKKKLGGEIICSVS